MTDEQDLTIAGVSGKIRRVAKNDLLFAKQEWVSYWRPISGYGPKASMRVFIRFDDSCSNGHNTFSITAEVTDAYSRRRGDSAAGGCLHDDIARCFPKLAHLIRWHLVSTDGPMHYIANTVYLAGDRDHNGLRKGEKKPLVSRKTGEPFFELMAIKDENVAIKEFHAAQYKDADAVPLYVLEKDFLGAADAVPVAPRLEWRQCYRLGEGKARELDAARSCAVWEDATDEDLCADPDVLRKALAARLPGLLARFRDAVEQAGFHWKPKGESNCWNLVSSEVDATGDLFADICDLHALYLNRKFRATPGERHTLEYMDAANLIKMIATPYSDCRLGETYLISVYKK